MDHKYHTYKSLQVHAVSVPVFFGWSVGIVRVGAMVVDTKCIKSPDGRMLNTLRTLSTIGQSEKTRDRRRRLSERSAMRRSCVFVVWLAINTTTTNAIT